MVLFAGGDAESETTTDSANFNATGLPIVNEMVTLSAFVMKDPKHGNYDEMPVLQEMEEATNVHFDWIETPRSNVQEKKNLLLASNDLPDIFMSHITDEDILIYGSQGVLIPNDELVRQYAPNLMAIYEEHPEVEKYMTAPDGHIYTAPRIQQLAHRVNGDNMFINQTWLDALGLDIPQTTDELAEVLRAFGSQDPNGNGQADEIPMSFIYPESASFSIYSFVGAFGALDNEGSHVTADEGQIRFTPAREEYRDAVRYLSGLYAEGLIDAEVFTHDVSQYTAKGNEADEIFGVFFAWFDENIVGVERAENDYVALPPLEGPGGDRMWNTNPWAVMARQNFAMTSANEYPEVSVRWLNEAYDLYYSYQLNAGTWGVNIEQVGDTIVYLDPPDGMSQDEFRYQQSPAWTTPYNLDLESYSKMELGSNHTRKIDRMQNVYSQYFPPIEDIFPPAFFSQEQGDELAILRTDINEYVSQMFARWVVGENDVDEGWDDYLTTLNRMGLDRYIEIHQEAYDSYYQ
jgi:putative aldouronate transport system substrate-binding protein